MKPEMKGILYMFGMIAIMVVTAIWIAGMSKMH